MTDGERILTGESENGAVNPATSEGDNAEARESVTADGDTGAVAEPSVIVKCFLDALFRAGRLNIEAGVESGAEGVVGELRGPDVTLFTGGTGRGLDALQYLCNRVLNRRVDQHPPVHLDAEGFKDRRARKLQDEAESAADEALRTRRAVVLGPYTPAARREIHLALADDPAVETESDGEGFLKRVVIRPRRRR